MIEQGALQAPGGGIGLHPGAPGLVHRVEHLAEDVELHLVVRGVADANRSRFLVAGEPGDLELGQPAFAPDAVHDVELLRLSGGGAQQPLAPGGGLFLVAGIEEGVQGEGRVAQPAEAVVPVADAAELLWQRRGRRRHDAAGGRIGQRLERDERAQHLGAPATLVGTATGPVVPELLGLLQGVERIDLARPRLVGRVPGDVEGKALSGVDVELGNGLEVLAARLDRAGQTQHVGAGDGGDAAVFRAHPGDQGPVVEAGDELGAHPHLAAHAFDDAHEVGEVAAQRHEVDEANDAAVHFQLGLQNQGVAAVAAAHAARFAHRGDEPAPVFRPAEQRGEAGPGIEAGKAQPVDRSVLGDQRRGLTVADERVILDAFRHPSILGGAGPVRKARTPPATLGFAGEGEGPA